ncbi:MAG: twin-arginine translocase TatA/TatE family subunit [Chloroflexi bacterium]|nr:twin-arginine translocase TatA/TatE family subunit [Chloroflexota bacterium]MDA1218494.1 twin-arginine translocase TatA/TatE family subunit [Chloroflexota bacterium]
MGMGMPEIVVIMVIAFLALGPSKSIDMARTAGKVIRDLRRTFNEITSAVTLDDVNDAPPRRPNTSATTSNDDPPPTSRE